MNDILDCIMSLKDTAMVLALWAGASALMWAYDSAKRRRREAAGK